jgi:hypothetical protein
VRLFIVALAFASLLITPLAADAQGLMTPMKINQPSAFSGISQAVASPQCQDGVVYDDGTVENGITFDTAVLDIVQRFDGVGGQMVDQLCLCWTRLPGTADIDFDFVFYEADGVGGQPGTFIDFFSATAEAVPEFPDVGLFSFDFSSLDFTLPDGDIYIGASWLPTGLDIFLCTDEDGGSTQPVYASGDLGLNWTDVADVDSALDAVIIRGDFSPVGGEPCVEGDTTLCLANDRFKVEVDWATPPGDTGQGMAVQLTPDTGYFWFFNDANVEMVIKVLDACSFADRFWVFAGGLTNVEVDITVTDTQTGTIQTYSNPLNTPFQPIQDTNAFATCP